MDFARRSVRAFGCYDGEYLASVDSVHWKLGLWENAMVMQPTSLRRSKHDPQTFVLSQPAIQNCIRDIVVSGTMGMSR